MSDPTSSNILLALPLRGSDSGVWDIPVNGNSVEIDGFLGGVQVVAVTNTPVTLTSPAGVVTPSAGPTQSENAVLRVTGALTSNVQITLPLPGYIIVENLTTGAFVLTLRAVGSGEVVGIGQGNVRHVYNDGTNVRFVNLPDVGTYLDLATSTIPAWITACTKPPYLLCDGSTFNATTYPYLNALFGGNVLPDARGRSPYFLNGGTGRLTSGGAGIDGNTFNASGGNNGVTLNASQIPTITSSGNNSITVVSLQTNVITGSPILASGPNPSAAVIANVGSEPLTSQGANNISVSSNNTSGGSFQNAAPGYVSGLRLVRAA